MNPKRLRAIVTELRRISEAGFGDHWNSDSAKDSRFNTKHVLKAADRMGVAPTPKKVEPCPPGMVRQNGKCVSLRGARR
jgi:hypothetical protein